MPSRHVALLRGINVGKAKRLAMADLRDLIGALGYRDVATLLNSGNVAFTIPGAVPGNLTERIERAIESRVGFSSRVTALSADELLRIVAKPPFGKVANDPSRLLVGVLTDPKDRAKLTPLARRDWAPEALGLGPRAAYLWCAEGILKSALLEAVSRTLGDGFTTRNWSTLLKLRDLAVGEGRPRA